MSTTQQQHQQFKDLLAQGETEAAEALWLELAGDLGDQPEFLLLLVKDTVEAGQGALAAELAGLLAPSLKTTGKLHEWLYALKLQAQAKHTDRALRTELVAAYKQVYHSEPRLNAILTATELEQPRSPLAAALTKTDTLLALAQHSYCQHKSWGFGRVKTFDAALNRMVVAFPHNPEHAMQLTYAAESLTPVSAEHIEVRKNTDLAAVRQLAQDDPLALLRAVLQSFQRQATAAQIEACLAGSVFPADQWKKWWDNARKLAKRDPHFEWPAKKTEPLRLRAAPVSQQDELLQAFRDAVSLSQKVAAAEELLKLAGDIENPDLLLQEFGDGLAQAIARMPADKIVPRLEAALVMEDLLAHQRAPTEKTVPLIGQILSSTRNLATVLDELGVSAQKRVTIYLKTQAPDRLVAACNELPAKVLDEIVELLAPAAELVAQHVQNQTASRELLYWLCKNVVATRPPGWLDKVSRPALLAAVFSAIEMADYRSVTKKLRDLLLADTAVLTELLADASPAVVRDHARRVMNSPAFEELDRRSLMAKLVKEYPFVQELLVNRTTKEQPLIVSRPSFDKRQAELSELVQKKIPENSKEIGVARSYGDLRENFEFKAAKETQRLLMRRRAELEVMIARANPTDFSEVNTELVGIGTTVSLTNTTTGQAHTYHILGAWDGNPERNILSYPAALAQALLNKKVGDTAVVTEEAGTQTVRIDRIEKTPAAVLQAL